MSTLVVSQEFISLSAISNALERIRNSLSFFNTEEEQVDFAERLDLRFVENFIKRYEYSAIRDHKAYIPPGLKTPLSHFLPVLHECVLVNEKLLRDVLNPFHRWVGVGLNNPETLKSVRKNTISSDFKPHDIQRLNSLIGKHFKLGSNHHHVPFKQVFENHKAYVEGVKKTDELVNRLIATERKSIIDKVKAITVSLNQLHENIEHYEDGFELSNASIEQLSSLTLTLAREVEFYSHTYYQVQRLNVAMKNTEDQFRSFK